MTVQRGDIFYADLGEGDGVEIGGLRPVVILQNNIVSEFVPTILVAPFTSNEQIFNQNLPTHVNMLAEQFGIVDSTILLEQIRCIDQKKLYKKIGRITDELLNGINQVLKFVTGDEDQSAQVSAIDNNVIKEQYYRIYTEQVAPKMDLKMLGELINAAKQAIPTEIADEEKALIYENLELLTEELRKTKAKKSIVQKCISTITNVAYHASNDDFSMKVNELTKFVMKY